MTKDICIRLPYLHPGDFCQDAWDAPLYLSVGLANDRSEQSFLPDYPLDQLACQRFMTDLRSLRGSELESMALAFNRHEFVSGHRLDEEWADLARFAGKESVGEGWGSLARKAHEVLLWCWLAEENALEIARLENACVRGEENLKNSFLEEIPPEPRGNARPENAFLPGWRVCAANAALFLPVHAAIFMEGPMAAEASEYLEFNPGEAMGLAAVPKGISALRAPLWRVLGHSAPVKENSALSRAYNSERLWLARLAD